MSSTIESPYRNISLPKPTRRHLYLEYKRVEFHYLATRWVLWGVGTCASVCLGYFFVDRGIDNPETQRMLMVIGIYWVIWSLRYTTLVLR